MDKAFEMETQKSTDEPQKPFTERGQRDDEVELVFKDEQKLYVSRNFLSYASPVFEAMFSHDFIEKQENKVDMGSKEFEDFLDFLLCLHPGLQKKVDASNVLRIVPIAEEYQVQLLASKCRAFMKSWLDEAANSARSNAIVEQIPYIRVCLRILEVVNMLNYEDDTTYSVRTVAKFGHAVLVEGRSLSKSGYSCYGSNGLDMTFNEELLRDVRKECITIFERLPAELRCRVLTERLLLKDDNKFSG